MKSKFAYGILASILLIVVGGLIYLKTKVFWSGNVSALSSNQLKVKTDELIILSEAAKSLENYYREPFDHELWGTIEESCLKKYSLGKASAFRLACSSEILSCLEDYLIKTKKPFYKKGEFVVQLSPISGNGQSQKIYQVNYPHEDFADGFAQKSHLLRLVSSKGESIDVGLLSNCQESFLDERFYAVGSEPTDKNLEIKFDTISKKIMLDKFQVRYGEIYDWALKTKKIQIDNNLFLEKKAFVTYTQLPQKLMHEYCQDNGKQIMLSHFYDAATFIPFDIKNKEPLQFPRGSYYWVKKNSEAWTYIYKKNNSDELITEKNCSLVYSKECFAKFLFHEEDLTPTWSGIYQVMGGPFEYLRNVLVPEENLRTSSKYFSIKSNYQQLGKRAFWDGRDFLNKNFIFEDIEKLPELEKGNNFEVAFRCFREVR